MMWESLKKFPRSSKVQEVSSFFSPLVEACKAVTTSRRAETQRQNLYTSVSQTSCPHFPRQTLRLQACPFTGGTQFFSASKNFTCLAQDLGLYSHSSRLTASITNWHVLLLGLKWLSWGFLQTTIQISLTSQSNISFGLSQSKLLQKRVSLLTKKIKSCFSPYCASNKHLNISIIHVCIQIFLPFTPKGSHNAPHIWEMRVHSNTPHNNRWVRLSVLIFEGKWSFFWFFLLYCCIVSCCKKWIIVV